MGLWMDFVNRVFGVQKAEPPPAPSPAIPPVVVNSSLLDEAMDWVRSGSRIDPQALQAMTLMSEDARLLASVFEGEEGRMRLMIFARMTVLRPAIDLSLPAETQLLYAAQRQGQDSIFAALVHYLDIHKASLKKASHDRYDRPHDDRFTDADPYDPSGTVAVSSYASTG